LEYYVRRALDTIMASPVVSGVTLSAVCVSVLFAGTVLLVASNAYRAVARTALGGIDVSIYFDQAATDADHEAASAAVAGDPAVVDRRFVSKEEAWQFLVDNLADDARLLDGLDASLLPASLELKLQASVDAEALATRTAVWRGLVGVSDVQHTPLPSAGTAGAVEAVGWVAWGLGVLALLVSLLIVGVAFRLAAWSRREELEVLRLMGAAGPTFWGPIVLGGAIEGLVAATLAVGVLLAGYMAVGGMVDRTADTGSFVPAFLAVGQALVLVGWGAVLGSVGAVVGVWRVAREH
jgi:cell division transport system permease protein